MHERELQGLRGELLRLKAQLEAIADSSKAASQPVELDQASVGRLSRIDAIRAQQMAAEGERRRQLQLRGIQAALRRLDTDEYGACEICAEDIDPRRLAVNPAATRCIECADQ